MNKRGGDFDYGNSGGKRARGGSGAKCELRIMVPSKVEDTRNFYIFSIVYNTCFFVFLFICTLVVTLIV